MVGHAIDVEEHRAGDVTGQIFLVRFPIGRRQEPAAVEDDDLWIAEMLGVAPETLDPVYRRRY